MSEAASNPAAAAGRKAQSISTRQALPRLVRDPLQALVDFGEQAGGEIVRLHIGAFRPYLVTNPTHVQHILRDNARNYVRDGKGMLWRPVKRLFGEGVLSDGPVWEASRRTLQPLFTAKRIDSIADRMGEVISEAVDELEGPARSGQPIDIGTELTKMVCRAIMRVLFADKVSVEDALRMVKAQDTIATAILPRLLVPFVPNSIPVPGDKAFLESVRTIDDVLLPVVREARERPDGGDDIVSTLARGRTADGREVDERQVRNDAVTMFATTTETTYGALTFLWPILQAHPDIAARLQDEIDRVVGGGQVRQEHLSELKYTRMVLEELLRLYPVGWLIPRTAAAADVVGGVRINAGASILISPYITQRMSTFWDRPEVFDPERFAPDKRHHRYAHYPFGGGPHQCLGQYLFYLEAIMIVATILGRFRFQLTDPQIPDIQVGASLRSRTRVTLTLSPADRSLIS